MKIGILTFHRAHNYGAVLQCYALQELLKSLGYNVQVIDYRPNYIENAYLLLPNRWVESRSIFHFLKMKIRDVILLPVRYIRGRRFKAFVNKYLDLSAPCTEVNIPSDYDVYIVGSDQIWNKSITKGFDRVFFCDFGFEKKNRKYLSYAASTELSDISNDDADFLEFHLNRFDAVSVRESALSNYIKDNLKKDVSVVVDPTLLNGKMFWDKLVSSEAKDGDYILLYQARYNAELTRKAKEIAKKMNCKLVEMSAWTIPLSRMCTKGMYASPLDFLSLIKNAKMVLNTSFHGTVFSIIYGIPFYYVELYDGWDSRAISLLSDLYLTDRIVSLDNCFESVAQSNVNFLESHRLLANLRNKSKQFLYNNI